MKFIVLAVIYGFCCCGAEETTEDDDEGGLYPRWDKILQNYLKYLNDPQTGGNAVFQKNIKKAVSQLAFYLRLWKHFEEDYTGEEVTQLGLYWRFPEPSTDFPVYFEQSGCFENAIRCIATLHRNLTHKGLGFVSHWWFDTADTHTLWRVGTTVNVTSQLWKYYKDVQQYTNKQGVHDLAMSYYFCWLTQLHRMDSLFDKLYYCQYDLSIDDKSVLWTKQGAQYATIYKDFSYFTGSFSSDPSIVEDDVRYRCSQFSFCPDPCCGRNRVKSQRFNKREFTSFEEECQEATRNPCNEETKLNTSCRYDPSRNGQINLLMDNMFTVDCHCMQHGFQYVYLSRGRGACMDIDECATNKHNCTAKNQEMCINTVGSYACACHFGHVRNLQDGKCKPIHDQTQN